MTGVQAEKIATVFHGNDPAVQQFLRGNALPAKIRAKITALETVDVCIVIGANDVVNPAAREVESSPIYGMPVINVDSARTVFVLKRSMASGFAGIENPLFYKENTRMLFGDAKESIAGLVREFSG